MFYQLKHLPDKQSYFRRFIINHLSKVDILEWSSHPLPHWTRSSVQLWSAAVTHLGSSKIQDFMCELNNLDNIFWLKSFFSSMETVLISRCSSKFCKSHILTAWSGKQTICGWSISQRGLLLIFTSFLNSQLCSLPFVQPICYTSAINLGIGLGQASLPLQLH
jgi:hypothetical protein